MIREFLQRIGVIFRPAPTALKTAPTPAPHEQYPEIFHWQAGDEIRSATYSRNDFWFHLISITEEGIVYGRNRLNDHKFCQPLWVVMRDGCNLTLRDREINDELKRTNEYMDLIVEFNKAFDELQKRDATMKMVS